MILHQHQHHSLYDTTSHFVAGYIVYDGKFGEGEDKNCVLNILLICEQKIYGYSLWDFTFAFAAVTKVDSTDYDSCLLEYGKLTLCFS